MHDNHSNSTEQLPTCVAVEAGLAELARRVAARGVCETTHGGVES